MVSLNCSAADVSEKLLGRWRRLKQESCSSAAVDYQAVSNAVFEIYSCLKLPRPTIIFCKSPLQVMVMPVALQFLLRSNQLWQNRDSLADLSDSQVWRQVWSTLAPQFALQQRESAPLVERRDRFPTNIDEQVEECIGRMKVPHADRCRKAAGREVWNAFMTAFESQIEKAPRSPFVPQLRSHLLNLPGVQPGWRELLKHIGSDEQMRLGSLCWQSGARGDSFLETRSPGRALIRSINSRFNINEIWWGVHAVAPSEWAVLLHVLAEELFMDSGNTDPAGALFRLWSVLLKQSLCYSFYPEAAFVCERREIRLNDQGMLHSQAGPAFSCRDGYQIYSRNGVTMPTELMRNPHLITVARIESEFNIEVQRVLIEMFGLERYLRESGAKRVDEDQYGVLYRKELIGDEPIVVVKVTNSTPEPDGTAKQYFLRVPPSITSAREAVAWTFGLDGREYHPAVET
ncbi:MAG TPA: hypothetical protein V6C72_03895 [Chroococcales cyanobacterium]